LTNGSISFIEDALPMLPKPTASLTSASSLSVQLNLPSVSSGCIYEKVALFYCSREDMYQSACLEFPAGHIANVELRHLPVGEYCFLRTIPISQGIQGEPSPMEIILVGTIRS
jgi:hypothetical protein